MTFAGSNAHIFPDMRAAGLKPTGQRIYLNTGSTDPGPVPAHWPVISGNTAHACVSIRPNLEDVIKGHLDADLKKFLRSAPKGSTSLLGLWHEASSMKYPGVTGEKLTAAQTHIKDLARKIDANVKVGAIDIVGILKPAEWMARNLDFYACDIYDNKHCNATPYSMMGKFKDQCDKLMDSGSATIGVTETNSRCSVRRPFWFQTVWSWLETRGFTSNSSCFLTYWNPTGPESGPWLPHDKATIKTLNTIFKHSSP